MDLCQFSALGIKGQITVLECFGVGQKNFPRKYFAVVKLRTSRKLWILEGNIGKRLGKDRKTELLAV